MLHAVARLRVLLSLFLVGLMLAPTAACASAPAPTTATILASSSIGSIAANKRRGAAVSGPAAVAYDTRFGTSTDAAGMITFGLHPGSRRIYCDASKADDSGDGLTPATAKKTLVQNGNANTCWGLFTGAGWTPGDQLMLAGKGGRTYTDDGFSGGWFNVAGLSATYPTAILSYDPTDPTNTAKYGHLFGSDRPRYLAPTNGGVAMLSTSTDGDGTHGNFAVQGLIVDGQNTDSAGMGSIGRHDNLVYQNNQFIEISLGNGSNGSVHGFSQNLNISKNSFYGSWRGLDGNTNGTFFGGVDAAWVQQNVYVHSAWKLHSSRDDTAPNGGPSVFGHGNYYAGGNTNGHFNGNLYFDSASDGLGYRGSGDLSQFVIFDDAMAGAFSGYSSDYAENLAGSLIVANDGIITGPDRGISASQPQNWGLSALNIRAGSRLNNALFVDDPYGASFVFAITNSSGQTLPQSVSLSNIRTHNYSTVAQSMFYATGNAALVAINWSNSLLDNLSAVGSPGAPTSISGTGVRTWTSGDYPNAYTRAQMITNMGFASKAAMVDAMLSYPHLPWAQAFIGSTFTGYGMTPVYATASVPIIAGLPAPTAIYNSPLTDLSLSTLTFPRGPPSSALVSGTSAGNFVLSSADLPSGFSFSGRSLNFDGSGSGAATPTIHVLETNFDGLGTHTTPLTLNITSAGATFDPAHAGDWTLSAGNLTATRNTTAGGFWAEARTTTTKTSGTLIFTVNALATGGNPLQIGMDDGLGTGQIGGSDSFGYYADGRVLAGGGQIFTWATYAAGDVIKVVLDGTGSGSCAFYKNNVLQGTITGTGAATAYYGAISNGNSTGTSVTVNTASW